MSDPRKEPGFKHKRVDDKTIMLLGAILDALYALAPQTPAPAEPQKRTRKEKAE